MSDGADTLRENLEALRLPRDAAPRARDRRRGRRVVVVVGALVLAVVAWQVAGRRAAVVEVATAGTVAAPQPGRPAELPVLSGAGYVVSADRYIAVGVAVGGRIDRYFVEEGDHVRAGDPLVQLDAREYAAAVRRAEANLQLARAEAELAAAQRRRLETLTAAGHASRDELDVKRATADTAVAKVAQAEADVAKAQVDLEYTTLRAPRGGVILAKLKEVGEIAVPGGFSGSGDLIRMANLDDLRGQVDVTESELAKLQLGQRAEVVPDAYPDARFAAHVVKLYPQVDRQKGTLRVEVQIEEPHDSRLWPDMSARVTFFAPVTAAAAEGPAVLVPRAAVRGDGDARFVWTVDDGRLRRVPVEVAGDFGDRVQVARGLRGGEQVVVGETGTLGDGDAVVARGG